MDLSRRRFFCGAGAVVAAIAATTVCARSATASPGDFEVTHTDAEWRQLLSADQYDVLRRAGTEMPYSSPLNDEHARGVFSCAGCALDLFASETKFDSGTGWPSFWQPLDGAVLERADGSIGMSRTEVLCRRCGGHLGHVFNDGPPPTGLRYCMNGDAMTFRST
jgi:peptide-methionine (R)-S-oxide reductase